GRAGHRRGVQHRERRRNEPAGACGLDAGDHGVEGTAHARAGAQGQSGATPVRRRRQGAPPARVRAGDRSRRGLAAVCGLVARGTVRKTLMTSPIADVLERIPLTTPTLDEREIEAAARPLRSGWLTQGPEVAAFEREFA